MKCPLRVKRQKRLRDRTEDGKCANATNRSSQAFQPHILYNNMFVAWALQTPVTINVDRTTK